MSDINQEGEITALGLNNTALNWAILNLTDSICRF